MASANKKPIAPAAVAAKPPSVAAKRPAAARGAAAKKPVPESKRDAATARKPVAAAPEARKTAAGKRQRLSKAFSRPLEKKLRKTALVRERFTLPEVEYEQLAVLKKRLSERGTGVKKSQLVRAGLLLVAALDDAALQALLAKVPPLD